MSSWAASVISSGAGAGYEVLDISEWVFAQWARLVRRIFVVRHIQQGYSVRDRARQLYRAEIRDKASRVLGLGK